MIGMTAVDADMTDVRFSRCNLTLARCWTSTYRSARFEHCALQEASFDGSDLSGAVFSKCDLTKADFRNAKLKKTDLRGSILTGIQINLRDLAGRIAVHEADLNDFGSTLEVVQRVRPDAIFHLAAHANVRASFITPQAVLANNILGTGNLFEAVRFVRNRLIHRLPFRLVTASRFFTTRWHLTLFRVSPSERTRSRSSPKTQMQ